MHSPAEIARSVAERTARESYGRLVAVLAKRTRDIAAAEDALAEAFARALSTWPTRGVPDSPEAWLLTVARRTVSSVERHRGVRDAARATLENVHDELSSSEGSEFPDERLKLLFVCAHPVIDPAVRTPLMLQTVLGLDAVRIGRAFLAPAATIGQRLVRAKKKIRDTGLRFDVPDSSRWAERLEDVLAAIYAAYSTG
ncbi:MAG: sigma factor, partial [Myxococcota bacterium]